jgi:hypothetical protein
MAVSAVTSAAVWTTASSGVPQWLRALCAVEVVVVLLGLGLYPVAWRALAYRSGWVSGRRELVESMREARRRGMDSSEWLAAELERTEATLFTAEELRRVHRDLEQDG